MKRTILLTVFCLISIFLLSSFQVSSPKKPHHLILKVTSSDSTKEVVFEGSYILRTDDPKLHNLNQSTPFIIDVHADYMSAIFHKVSGISSLQVDIMSIGDNHIIEHSALGSGEIILAGSRLGKEGVDCFVEAF